MENNTNNNRRKFRKIPQPVFVTVREKTIKRFDANGVYLGKDVVEYKEPITDPMALARGADVEEGDWI